MKGERTTARAGSRTRDRNPGRGDIYALRHAAQQRETHVERPADEGEKTPKKKREGKKTEIGRARSVSFVRDNFGGAYLTMRRIFRR